MLMSNLGSEPGRLVSNESLAEPSSPAAVADAASTPQQQREAVAALIDHTNGDIFAWLKLVRSARSIEPLPGQRSGSAHLSTSQILALFALKDCPNDRLLAWLELARLCRNDPSAVAFEPGLSLGSGLSNNPSFPLQQSDPSPFGNELWAKSAEEYTLWQSVSPISQPFAINDLSGLQTGRLINLTPVINAENGYSCTVCEEPKSYKDSGSWKKHEKEHETLFVCGLDDAAEGNRKGQSVASKPFTCKRRDIMVNHLHKSHGIMEPLEGRDVADQWRHTVKKQAWSCGFCVSFFLTFQDRLKHIDLKHFREHQSIHDWDFNKVILGLLQQPKMTKAWKMRTASLPPWVHPENFVWDKATSRGLRATLEIGPLDDHNANTLADVAFGASNSDEGSWHQNGTTYTNGHSDATAHAGFVSSQNYHHATSALASDSGSYHRPAPATTGTTNNFASGGPSYFEVPTSASALGNMVEPSIPSSDGDRGVDHSALLFSPSQSWHSGPEPGSFFNGYEFLGNFSA